MIKRDYFTSRNKDLRVNFFIRPYKEFIWWTIYLIKYHSFHLVKPLHIYLRGLFLKKNKSYARRVNHQIKGMSILENKDFYEIQIKHETRASILLEEEQKLEINQKINSPQTLVFGVSPLIEEYTVKNIKSWSVSVKIKSDNNIEESYSVNYPFNSFSSFAAYQQGEGWIDFKIDLSEYLNKSISIELTNSIYKKNKGNTENFSVSNPQLFSNRSNSGKNIILLSFESLSDLDYLYNNYQFPELKNFTKIIEDSFNFKDAFAPIDSTLPYAASLQTGLMPSQHGIGNYRPNAYGFKNIVPTTDFNYLSQNLKEYGFINFFGGTATRFSSKIGFARGYDSYFQVGKKFNEHNPDFQWLMRGLDNYYGFDKYFCLHLDQLHAPYLAFDDLKKPYLSNLRELDHANMANQPELYYEGLKNIDRDLGTFVSYLKSTNQYDSTMIIITGDHGSGKNWEKNSGYSLYDERLRVPLIVKSAEWSEDLKLDRDIFSSVFNIHELIYKSLGKELPDHLIELPQYRPEYYKYAFAETIMNPGNEEKRHTLATISEDYKFVAWNIVDWETASVDKTLKEAIYIRNKTENSFDESINLIDSLEKDIVKEYRDLSTNVLNENLLFRKEYPGKPY